MELIQEIENIGVVPVITLNDAGKAAPLAGALKRGGIPCAEVTFRTSQAAAAIKNMTDAVAGMLVGAGTITTIRQAEEAVAAGAKFIVSPGFNEKVVEYCLEKQLPVIPGVQTPSEIERAMEFGLKTLKFFPAEQSGGAAMLKALSGPYRGIKFMPTGGITAANLNDYLALDCVAACGGSFMAEPSLVDAEKYDEIETICRSTVNRLLAFRVKHMGINSDEASAYSIAEFFLKAFGFETRDGNSSIMAGDQIEITKKLFPGAKGHLGIGTNSVRRAIYHLEKRGLKFNDNTVKKDNKGNTAAIYLEKEIGGFAIHLVKN